MRRPGEEGYVRVKAEVQGCITSQEIPRIAGRLGSLGKINTFL